MPHSEVPGRIGPENALLVIESYPSYRINSVLPGIASFVHFAHSTSAKERENLVRPNRVWVPAALESTNCTLGESGRIASGLPGWIALSRSRFPANGSANASSDQLGLLHTTLHPTGSALSPPLTEAQPRRTLATSSFSKTSSTNCNVRCRSGASSDPPRRTHSGRSPKNVEPDSGPGWQTGSNPETEDCAGFV
jgi:hypothetical protein